MIVIIAHVDVEMKAVVHGKHMKMGTAIVIIVNVAMSRVIVTDCRIVNIV
jgi:hypothetical protein